MSHVHVVWFFIINQGSSDPKLEPGNDEPMDEQDVPMAWLGTTCCPSPKMSQDQIHRE